MHSTALGLLLVSYQCIVQRRLFAEAGKHGWHGRVLREHRHFDQQLWRRRLTRNHPPAFASAHCDAHSDFLTFGSLLPLREHAAVVQAGESGAFHRFGFTSG